MTGRAQRITHEIFIYAGGSFVASAILYLAVPIYTRIFTKAEFGDLILLQTIGAMLAAVMIVGGDVVLSRFWFENRESSEIRRLVTTWLGFLVVWSFLVAGVALLAARTFLEPRLESAEVTLLVTLGILVLPFVQANRMAAQLLRNDFRPSAYALTSIVLAVLSVGLGLLAALRAGLGPAGVFAGMLVAEILVLAWRLVLARERIGARVQASLLPRLLRLGAPLVPVSLTYWVFSASERVVLAASGGSEAVAQYGLATTLVTVLAVLMVAVGQAWVPRVIERYESGRQAALRETAIALTYWCAALGLAATTIAALSPEIILLLGGAQYAAVASIVPVLMLGAVAYGSTVITSGTFTLAKRTGRLIWSAGAGAATNVILALALVPRLGLWGAALASVSGYVVVAVLHGVLAYQLLPVPYEGRRLISIVVVTTGAMTAITLALDAPLAVRLLAVLFYVGLVPLIGGVTDTDRQVIHAVAAGFARRVHDRGGV